MNISDNALVEAYFSAIELSLHDDFIDMLEEEIEKRDLLHKINAAMTHI